MRGGSWSQGCSQVASNQIDDVMHSSDQFNDLGFRVVTLAEPSQPQPVPALSGRGLLAALLLLALAGAIVLRPPRRSSAG
jgi:hypothetical protein